MAAKEGLIDPFEPSQVSAVGDRKVISYGTSSYGYDLRCSDEFRIFTNVHSSVVDPKDFDERSFVSTTGETCLIPPNSFALARSVERFRIPRAVSAPVMVILVTLLLSNLGLIPREAPSFGNFLGAGIFELLSA